MRSSPRPLYRLRAPLAALFAAGVLALPLAALGAQALPEDEFEPPLADIEALSPEEREDLRAFIESLPEPGEQNGWRGAELDAEDRVTKPPERQAILTPWATKAGELLRDLAGAPDAVP